MGLWFWILENDDVTCNPSIKYTVSVLLLSKLQLFHATSPCVVTKLILLVLTYVLFTNYMAQVIFTVMMALKRRPMDMAVKTKFYNDNDERKFKVFFQNLVIEISNVFTLYKASRKATWRKRLVCKETNYTWCSRPNKHMELEYIFYKRIFLLLQERKLFPSKSEKNHVRSTACSRVQDKLLSVNWQSK